MNKQYDPIKDIKDIKRKNHFDNGGTLSGWINPSKIYQPKKHKKVKHKKEQEWLNQER